MKALFGEILSNKTHKTAAVIIPPDEIWPPIQNIRQKHDKQIRLWMPHITLLYPFRPREEFDAMAPRLLEELEGIEPFFLELREFRLFRHRGHSSAAIGAHGGGP